MKKIKIFILVIINFLFLSTSFADQPQGMDPKIQHLEEYIAQNPSDAIAIKDLGNAYLSLGNFDKAIEQYSKAIAINPHPNFYNNRCFAWNNKMELDKALEDCNTALSLDPGHTFAFINRGNAFYLKREYDKAIADYTKSLKVVPAGDKYNPPMSHYNRGLAYLRQYKLGLATADFIKVIEFKFFR
ncbi:MAG: tetratricopeptide repeat protein [Candidatus Omnitrophica bacterium]|nr:tetratricopeptide repeat protein [Candidatus Omnitrophota bacterium]